MKLYIKLFAIQGKVSVTKDGLNPHFRSKYMTLDNIVETLTPELNANKLLVTHFIENWTLVTRIVDIETAEVLDSHFPMNATDPQKVGSEISYWKRYNLVAMFNICADEDDDANSCSNNATTSNATTPSATNTLEYIKSENIDALMKNIEEWAIICPSADEAIRLAKTKYKVAKWAEEEIREKWKKIFI